MLHNEFIYTVPIHIPYSVANKITKMIFNLVGPGDAHGRQCAGSGSGLSPVQHQAITGTNIYDVFQLYLHEPTPETSESKYNTFLSIKCTNM